MNRYYFSGIPHVKVGDDVLCCNCKLEIGVYTANNGRTTEAFSQCPRCGWDQRTKKYKPCECNSDFCLAHRSNFHDREENADPNGYIQI